MSGDEVLVSNLSIFFNYEKDVQLKPPVFLRMDIPRYYKENKKDQRQ